MPRTWSTLRTQSRGVSVVLGMIGLAAPFFIHTFSDEIRETPLSMLSLSSHQPEVYRALERDPGEGICHWASEKAIGCPSAGVPGCFPEDPEALGRCKAMTRHGPCARGTGMSTCCFDTFTESHMHNPEEASTFFLFLHRKAIYPCPSH